VVLSVAGFACAAALFVVCCRPFDRWRAHAVASQPLSVQYAPPGFSAPPDFVDSGPYGPPVRIDSALPQPGHNFGGARL
jgi:hypothetical protein